MKCRYSDESTKKFNPALEVYEHFECDEFLKYDEAHTKNGISYANSWICPKGHIRIILGYWAVLQIYKILNHPQKRIIGKRQVIY